MTIFHSVNTDGMLVSEVARGPGAYRDRSCHKKSQRHPVLGSHNSFIILMGNKPPLS